MRFAITPLGSSGDHTVEQIVGPIVRYLTTAATGRLDAVASVVSPSGHPTWSAATTSPSSPPNALRDWCRFAGTAASYIDPGSPWQNPWVESYGSRIRNELLAIEQFDTLLEAQVLVADWRVEYNDTGPTPISACSPRPSSPTGGGGPTNPNSRSGGVRWSAILAERRWPDLRSTAAAGRRR